jgi:hypothetical protein
MEGLVVPMRNIRNEYSTPSKNFTRKDHLGVDEKVILSVNLREEGSESVGWIRLTRNKVV